MENSASEKCWEEAHRVLAGGVNSPVRAFKAVGGHPFFVHSGWGPFLTDVDGNEYIDYVLSWGPLILGHAHARVVAAVCGAMARGSSFGAPIEDEIRLAERIIRHQPGIERLRMVNSGTEAAMSALRLARAFTGREYIVKIEGGYHGHVDSLLVRAGSGPTSFGSPDSAGITASQAAATLTVPFNDLEAAKTVFKAHGDRIAALIVEPVPGNMGVILPGPGYLEGLREITRRHGALLIFDEVMSGFRVALGGAARRYGVTPDLTTLGKVIGGGLPIGAYGGPLEIMDLLAPNGPVYQAGTLSGNPLAVAAGLATLDVIEEEGVFTKIEAGMTTLCLGLEEIATRYGVPLVLTQAGAMAGLFFHEGPVCNYAGAIASDTHRYARFFHGMRERGVYFAPSAFEAFFMSLAHGPQELDRTLNAADATFAELQSS
jgi:glutamate-1-semialdehyde 2,1-aminomutase